jgi:deaminated glutathione amidase
MTASAFRIGLVQMCSGCDIDRNLKDASSLIREAHAGGAQFIATPEMTNILDVNRERVLASVNLEGVDRAPKIFAELAHELGIYLLIGSMALKSPTGKLVNRSLLFNPKGKVTGRYDKIHMFDVELNERETFRESRSYQAGDRAVVAELPWAKLGLTICYDLRFPGLYRSLAKAEAYLISVPSAFTQLTGQAHWHVLLQARAIEDAAFIAAPAQSGKHECGRRSYGHSLVVDPWGGVIGDGGEEQGITMAMIDPSLAARARHRIPAFSHDRPLTLRRCSLVE